MALYINLEIIDERNFEVVNLHRYVTLQGQDRQVCQLPNAGTTFVQLYERIRSRIPSAGNG